MKRALAMGLGALMVAGTAAPASAASHIDFSGYYRIMYMSETNTGYGRESQSFTDSYFQDRLQLDLTFSPTDEISIYWRLRGPGSYQRWGRMNTPGRSRADKSLYTRFIYGEIKQDWGTVLIGRMSDDLDCAGLCTFGYMPETIPIFTSAGAFDRGDIMDGIRYSYDWDNGFSILAQYVKIDNNDQSGDNGGWGASNMKSDQDWDRFQVQVAYAWDGGGASLHGFYDRNATGNGEGWAGVDGRPSDWNQKYYADADFGSVNKFESWGLNPSIMHTWGDFSVHFEGMAQWGKTYYNYNKLDAFGFATGRRGEYSRTATGYGAYLDFDYNYGPGNATLAGWWVSGSDLNDTKDKSIADIVGGNFYPLLVAYNGVNSNPGGNRHFGNAGNKVSAIAFANNAYENYVQSNHQDRLIGGDYIAINKNVDLAWGNFNSDILGFGANNRTRTVSFNNDTDANHWAIALTGNHAFTDDISMHYGLAYLALNKANYRIVNSAAYNGANYTGLGYTTQDKDLGFEIDLGFTFQLLDNLKFTTAFGYMFNGDAYKQFKGYKVNQALGNTGANVANGDTIRGVWEDADDSYVWFNSLTFAF